jgi:ubiquinone/menaquinone biosynthesis C-methylase UbiE
MTTTARSPHLSDIVPGLELPVVPRCAIDVGCGTGDDVRWLADAGFQAVGIDVNAQTLATAATLTPPDADVSWVQGSATALPLADSSCVLIIDRGCLHHIATDDRPQYASEAARVLAPGGAWLIRDLLGHAGQVAELDTDSIDDLTDGLPVRVEAFETVEASSPHGSHTWIIAVLRRG